MLLSHIVMCADCGHIADEHDNGGTFNDPCDIDGCGCYGYVADPDDYQQIATQDVTSIRLTLAEAEQIVGAPAREWAGNCFAVATALADRVGGIAVYGAWDGPIAPTSLFAGRPSANHGWVQLTNGQVFDPTRWEFEGLDPYLFEGDSDYYDEGRNRQRAENLPPFPEANDEPLELNPGPLAAALAALCGGEPIDRYTIAQWMWFANLPWDTLGEHRAALYDLLIANDRRALIPIDNRFRHEREHAAA